MNTNRYEPIDDFDKDCRSCRFKDLPPSCHRCSTCVHNYGNINDTDKYEPIINHEE